MYSQHSSQSEPMKCKSYHVNSLLYILQGFLPPSELKPKSWLIHRPYLISAPTLWSCWLHLQLFPTSASLLSLEHVRHVFTVPQDLPEDSSLTSFSSYSTSPSQGSLLRSPYLKSQPHPQIHISLILLIFPLQYLPLLSMVFYLHYYVFPGETQAPWKWGLFLLFVHCYIPNT